MGNVCSSCCCPPAASSNAQDEPEETSERSPLLGGAAAGGASPTGSAVKPGASGGGGGSSPPVTKQPEKQTSAQKEIHKPITGYVEDSQREHVQLAPVEVEKLDKDFKTVTAIYNGTLDCIKVLKDTKANILTLMDKEELDEAFRCIINQCGEMTVDYWHKLEGDEPGRHRFHFEYPAEMLPEGKKNVFELLTQTIQNLNTHGASNNANVLGKRGLIMDILSRKDEIRSAVMSAPHGDQGPAFMKNCNNNFKALTQIQPRCEALMREKEDLIEEFMQAYDKLTVPVDVRKLEAQLNTEDYPNVEIKVEKAYKGTEAELVNRWLSDQHQEEEEKNVKRREMRHKSLLKETDEPEWDDPPSDLFAPQKEEDEKKEEEKMDEGKKDEKKKGKKEHKHETEENKKGAGDNKTSEEHKESEVHENPLMEHKEASEENKEGSEEQKEASEEHKEGSEDHKEGSEEHKASEEHKEASEEHKEGSEEHKASEEHKEASEEHKEGSEEHKEGSVEHKPSEEHKASEEHV